MAFPKTRTNPTMTAEEFNAMAQTVAISGIILNSGVAVGTTSGTVLTTNATVFFLKNTGSNNVYIGFDDTVGTGKFYLEPNEEVQINASHNDVRYMTSSSTSTLQIIAAQAKQSVYDEAYSYSNAAVGTASATAIISGTTYDAFLVINSGSNPAYIGIGSDATVANYKVNSSEKLIIEISTNKLTAISTGGNTTLRVLAFKYNNL